MAVYSSLALVLAPKVSECREDGVRFFYGSFDRSIVACDMKPIPTQRTRIAGFLVIG